MWPPAKRSTGGPARSLFLRLLARIADDVILTVAVSVQAQHGPPLATIPSLVHRRQQVGRHLHAFSAAHGDLVTHVAIVVATLEHRGLRLRPWRG
jgi:hypothetical protein